MDQYACRYCGCFKYSHFNKRSKLFHKCYFHTCERYAPKDNLVYLEQLFKEREVAVL